MGIDSINSTLTNLRNLPKVSSSSGQQSTAPTKSLGEVPPMPLTLEQIGSLATLFQRGGLIHKLKNRLNRLKNKKCKVIPARGTIACIDSDDIVYVGVDFLEQYQNQEDVIAGVLAHEWGHSCAERPAEEEVQSLSWDEIFELRRAHETLADDLSGRLLALMGYKPDGLIKFLGDMTVSTHNLKYHSPQTRQEIIAGAYHDEIKKINFANQIFPKSTYVNQYHSIIIDEVDE